MAIDDMCNITLRLRKSKYREWQLYLEKKYNIVPFGRYSEITNKNTEVFLKAIDEEMKKG